MGLTVGDCMKLTALRESRVVAGSAGLNNIVASISVLEYADVASLIEGLFMGNELVITGLICIKDDISAQCAVIRHLHDMGEVGLILYYVGIFLPGLDERVLQTADELGFPIILMPENKRDLRYSEVITEVMEAIFKDRMQETYFVNEILERISRLPSHQQTIDRMLRMISDRIRSSILLADRTFTALNIAAWPMSAALNEQDVLAYYKNRPTALQETNPAKIAENGRMVFAEHQTIILENGSNMNVIILSESANINDFGVQTAEVIRLYMNIWKFNHNNSGYAELLRAIMKDEPDKMRRLAEILHVDVASIHVMWVLKSEEKGLSEKEKAVLNAGLLIMTRAFLQEHNRVAVVDIYEDNVIGFMSNPICMDQANSQAGSFMAEMNEAGMNAFFVVCTDLQNTAEVREAYNLIVEYYKDSRIIYPRKQIITIEEIEFVRKCREIINQGEKAVERHLIPLRPLRWHEAQQERELISTLEVFLLDTESSISLAAGMLFVHKNTIKYRLRKIHERLNHHVLKQPEAFNLYLAAALERLLKKSE